MKRILVGTLAALTVTAAWLASTALASPAAPRARHTGRPGRIARNHHASARDVSRNAVNQGGMGDRDCDRDDRRDCGHCPPGSAAGDYCECPPGSAAGDYCECPPGSAAGDHCECPPQPQRHHGCEPDRDRGGPGHRRRDEDSGWCKGMPSIWRHGGEVACFGLPADIWLRLAGAPRLPAC